MSYSGDAAEQVVRMTLEGAEVAAKITGAGAKEVAVLLYAILRDQKKTKGKTRLTNMLRSGKELKVFAVKDTDLQRFCQEAKKYGVLYCVLKDKNANDGITDIMVRAEDASKINRIFERFQLATVDLGNVKSEIERSRAEKERAVQEETPSAADKEEQFLDALLSPVTGKEERKPENPIEARAAKPRQSEPISMPKESAARGISNEPARTRSSVRQELNEIKAEQRQKSVQTRERTQSIHKDGPKKKPKKQKER